MLDDCDLFSISSLVDLDHDALLLLGHLFADAEFPGKTADRAHLRTHLVSVTSVKSDYS